MGEEGCVPSFPKNWSHESRKQWQTAGCSGGSSCLPLPAAYTRHSPPWYDPQAPRFFTLLHLLLLPSNSLSLPPPSSLAEIEKHLIRPGWKCENKNAKFEGELGAATTQDNYPSFHVGRLLNSTKPLAAFRRGKNHAGDSQAS